MKPDTRFLKQPKSFWANVRAISQKVNYTDRKTSQIKVPSVTEIQTAFRNAGLNTALLLGADDQPTEFGKALLAYFQYRADILNTYVEPHLMNATQAQIRFEALHAKLSPTRSMAMNKQKGDKKVVAYLTGIVNMLIESNVAGFPCDYDPQQLITVTKDDFPLRTLARRVDGAFPSTVNPIAVWEIKEYYHTTTFGSRVADGVYETLLDGMEIEELREHEGIDIKHYLFVDAHYTWWTCGRSYLCRLIDMLHMGYVDEILFGSEVEERLPTLVKEWLTTEQRRRKRRVKTTKP